MQLTKYSWWGEENSPPENLKTKKQLSEIGLSPKQPVGVIECRKYDVMLYDINNPESVKPKRKASEKQLAVLAANREKQKIRRDYEEWYREVGFIERDRVDAVKWARDQLNLNDWVILDTETTGLYDAEIVEIAVIDRDGRVLLNTLIKPSISIPNEVVEIHGINDEMVMNSPTFPEIYPKLKNILSDKRLFIYNAEFDIKILNYCCHLHNLPILSLRKRSECLMEWVSQWAGDWSYYHKSYRWQPLNGGHRALDDCLAALDRLKRMAEDSDKVDCPVSIPENNKSWE